MFIDLRQFAGMVAPEILRALEDAINASVLETPFGSHPTTSYPPEYIAALQNRSYEFQSPPLTIGEADIGNDFYNMVIRNTSTDKNLVFSSGYTSHDGGGADNDWKAMVQAFVQDACVDPISGFTPWYALPTFSDNPVPPEVAIYASDGTPGGIVFPADPPGPLFPEGEAIPSAGIPAARGFLAGNEDEVEGLRNIYIIGPGQSFVHGFNVEVVTRVWIWGTFFFAPVGRLA